MTLSEICSLSIVNKDIDTINYLIEVCDRLHAGEEDVDGFEQNELPSDEKYEEMKRVLKANTRVSLLQISNEEVGIVNKKYIRKPGQMSNNVNTLGIKHVHSQDPNHLLLLDGIQIESAITTIEDALLMKKYDGCSIACVFSRTGPMFKFESAKTRGDADPTTKIRLVIAEFETALNKLIDTHESIKLLVKDKSKIGNCNTPIEYELITSDIVNIIFRGELVLKQKIVGRPSAAAVAGPLNGKFETFRDKVTEFCWKPFEIISIILKDGTHIVPCQKCVLDLLVEMKQYNPDDVLRVRHLDSTFDFAGLLRTWMNTETIPLDGIVYCPANFTYPTSNEESSKRVRYGKYKYKKNDSLTTKITGFEYNIGSTGKFTCVATVDRIVANGKNYERMRIPFRKIQDALVAGPFGINTIVEVTLSKDIILTLSKTLPNISTDVVPYEFPRICPYCNSELLTRTTKADTVICCNNKYCKGILMKRLEVYLSAIGVKGISEATIFNYFESRPFSFKDFYRDIINIPVKSNVRRTGKSVVDKNTRYNYNELLAASTNEKLLIAFQIATPSTLKNKMDIYGLSFGRLDLIALKRIEDPLVKEILF